MSGPLTERERRIVEYVRSSLHAIDDTDPSEEFKWKPTKRKHEVNDRLRIRAVREAMRPDSWLWDQLDKWYTNPTRQSLGSDDA